MAYSWVTLTAKVYVDSDEVEELVGQGVDLDGEPLPENSYSAAFASLARQKINDHFPTDEPMKLNDIDIDLSTFKL